MKEESVGHMLFMDNNFFIATTVFWPTQWEINCCGTVHHDRQGMPKNCGLKTLKLQKGDNDCKVKGGTRAVCWKDKRQIYLLTNKNNPASGLFVNKEGNASKPVCIKSYTKSMGFVDLSVMMENSYSISLKTWNGLKSLHPPTWPNYPERYHHHHSQNVGVTHTKIVLRTACGVPYPCSQDINPRPSNSSRGRQPLREFRHFCLDFRDSDYWPAKVRSRICNVGLCSSQGKTSRSFRFCVDCDVGLCVYLYFKLYHIVWYSLVHSTTDYRSKWNWVGAVELFDV